VQGNATEQAAPESHGVSTQRVDAHVGENRMQRARHLTAGRGAAGRILLSSSTHVRVAHAQRVGARRGEKHAEVEQQSATLLIGVVAARHGTEARTRANGGLQSQRRCRRLWSLCLVRLDRRRLRAALRGRRNCVRRRNRLRSYVRRGHRSRPSCSRASGRRAGNGRQRR
jgi:hypothetical protein